LVPQRMCADPMPASHRWLRRSPCPSETSIQGRTIVTKGQFGPSRFVDPILLAFGTLLYAL
jgi:hypothetical protein